MPMISDIGQSTQTLKVMQRIWNIPPKAKLTLQDLTIHNNTQKPSGPVWNEIEYFLILRM